MTSEKTESLHHSFVHDLRNPLNAISMSAELGALLLNEESIELERLKIIFADIQDQCQECATILEKSLCKP